MAQGKVGSIPANAVDDGQWSQGLISAVSTSDPCDAPDGPGADDLRFLSPPGPYGSGGYQQSV